MRAFLDDRLDKHLGVVALAEHAAVVVGEADDDRLDLALVHQLRKFGRLEQPASLHFSGK